MGQKPDDTRAVPLCQRHHMAAHTIGEDTIAKQYRLDIEKAIAELCRQSPALKRMQRKDGT
jgi:hypothetical protein